MLKLSRKSRFLLALLTLSASACVPKPTGPEASGSSDKQAEPEPLPVKDRTWMNLALTTEQRVEALLAQMTQNEKLELLFGYYGAHAQWKQYTRHEEARPGSAGVVPGNARLGIPPQWQTDAGIGVATQGSEPNKRERTALPSGLCSAASWDPDLAEKGGAMIGAEAHASGFNVMLSGSVNLLRDPHNGRNFEYAGEDPFLAGTMVGAHIRGIQSEHVISTMKHFAVNDQETDRDKGDSVLDPAAARMSDLLAFEFAHEVGRPGSVMCAYNQVNGVFSCENEWLLTGVLRRDWGFSGYVLSDWGAVHSTAKAANAGLEQSSGFPFDDQPYFGEPLRAAIEKGEVSQARLNEMASRILGAMFEHGLFDFPADIRDINFEKNGEVSQRAAEDGAVLLKNGSALLNPGTAPGAPLLPLAQTVKTIAVIGGYADRGVLSGGGSAQVYPRGGNAVPGLQPSKWPGPVVYFPSSPLEELRRLYPNAKITFDAGKAESAAKLAKSSDVALVFVTQWTTESIDTEITLPDGQDALIEAVAAANPKTVVILETGGQVLMPWASKVGAILQAWYPGSNGGKAIARVLAGQVNPSGHLPFTIPTQREHFTHSSPPKPGKVLYAEGATVGYKWFDQKKLEPLFAFGHGLSYTTFSHRELSASAVGQGIEATFTIQNTGTTAGKDVAQIYVARPGWEAPQRLGAFAKVDLAPGESKSIKVRIDPRLLATWDEKSLSWMIAAGPAEVRLASTSRVVHERVQVELAGSTIPAGGPEGTP